ncbi:MAG: SGNH/GDSL hydrolase family protein [Desulfobacteraceae bacterium]|nr:SGNH/GDSL hydrolase family protein [Desulfobacteraceae bacterium]
MKHKLWVSIFFLVTASIFVAVSCTPTSLAQKDCVVMLGDSIFALSGEETNVLQDLSGQKWRTYYVSGAQMTGGTVRTIPQQYTQAKNANSNIRTVILDGGGNDVLIGGQSACTSYTNTLSASCETILSDVKNATEKMLNQMATDGVQNVIWQGYYHTTNAGLHTVADISTERAIEGIASFQAKHPEMKVIYIDVRPSFSGAPASYTIADGIHPTAASSATLANLVWNTMVNNGIEQTNSCSSSSSSGGCN